MGSTVTVLSRQLKIIDFGDDYTRLQLQSKSERYCMPLGELALTLQPLTMHGSPCRTLAMVKPDAIKHLGKILNAIYQSGFRVK